MAGRLLGSALSREGAPADVFATAMNTKRQVCPSILQDYYRTNSTPLELWEDQDQQVGPGFFHFGPDIVCFGKSTTGASADFRTADRYDARSATRLTNEGLYLPFDFSTVIENLRREHYVKHLSNGHHGLTRYQLVRKAYYSVREFLPVSIRRHFQKAYFKDWRNIQFPHWPVDFTADILHEEFLKLTTKALGLTRIPFIWFWPDGATACAVLTHDVETSAGRDFTSALMDLDLAYGFRSSFQVVPEKRYDVPDDYWREIRGRSFEFNVHDLKHDGQLFQDKSEFERRAKLINGYARKYDSRGFRAGAMYRNLDWFDAFEFSYDMSVPNVAHLEPQRGGCCTVMPYFVGHILEIPLTTSQDYTVFNILEEFSIDLWKQQIGMILKRNGLMSFLSHPDYLIDTKPRAVYASLLAHLREVCDANNVWHALPGELDGWWRARAHMDLVRSDDNWQIAGPEANRARVAYANLDDDRIVYSLA